MTTRTPPPDALRVQRLLDGARVNIALATALELHFFEHLSKGPATVGELAARASVSERGAQTLLDAFVALELVTIDGGRYRNTPAAELLLVPSGAMYVGDEHAALLRMQMRWGVHLDQAVRTGHPVVPIDDPAVLEFWTHLTPMISRMTGPVASQALGELGLTDGAPALLDVGGGMAVYSLALLGANPRARSTQADWPHINKSARALVEKAGFADRFATIDGNFQSVELGEASFDVAVLSNIMHQESPASNRALLTRLHRALRPDGQLVIAEFMVDDGRTGPPMPLLFNLNMLTLSDGGKSYERGELTALVTEAGFASPRFVPAGPVATLIFARKAPIGIR
jgi:SAM-dependent methyltransferase